jgi:hypothetical protein
MDLCEGITTLEINLLMRDLGYSRTALLIWPKKFDSDIALHYYMLYAREHLRVPKSKQATRKEKKVLAELIQWLREDARGDDLTEAVEIVTRISTNGSTPVKRHA